MQLCRRIDHVETRSPPYVFRIVASDLVDPLRSERLELALARGKEQRDKRRDLAKRDAQREMERALRRRR